MTLLPRPPDGCPACLTQQRSAVTAPCHMRLDGADLEALYECGECGNRWVCHWNTSALAGPGMRGAA